MAHLMKEVFFVAPLFCIQGQTRYTGRIGVEVLQSS